MGPALWGSIISLTPVGSWGRMQLRSLRLEWIISYGRIIYRFTLGRRLRGFGPAYAGGLSVSGERLDTDQEQHQRSG